MLSLVGLRRLLLLLCALLCAAGRAYAHVGAPDVYVKADAGPYALLVSVHPPVVVPGTASVDVRTGDRSVNGVDVALPDGGWQPLTAFAKEQLFTGEVWVAKGGAWRLRLRVHGTSGEAETSLPVAAGPRRFLFSPLFWLLCLGILGGLIFTVRLPHRRLAGGATALIAVLFVVLLVWSARTGSAAPLMELQLVPGGRLNIALPGREGDLIEDHRHLMHLFAVREPEMDVLLHLHPIQIGPGIFTAQLPSMAGGAFLLFADVVHRDGSLETFTAQAGLPPQTGLAVTGDDTVGVAPGIARTTAVSGPGKTTVPLPDGYSMTLQLDATLHAKTGRLLCFTLLDAAGIPPADMQLYMGMSAHAAVFKTDGTVFAHIHPAGTIPMAAYGGSMSGMDMSATPSSAATFPFGFPSAGAYRVFVEMKHGGVIETGAFDLTVIP
jgi:hypothetical protein